MGARKEASVTARFLRPLGIGIVFVVLVCVVVLLILAAIMTTGVIPTSAVTPIALAVAAFGVFAGGFAAARLSNERGLLYGAGVGLLFYLLVTVVGIAASQELRGTMMLLKAALIIGGGALGGVLGVNFKKR